MGAEVGAGRCTRDAQGRGGGGPSGRLRTAGVPGIAPHVRRRDGGGGGRLVLDGPRRQPLPKGLGRRMGLCGLKGTATGIAHQLLLSQCTPQVVDDALLRTRRVWGQSGMRPA